jgi:hypothetical protein
MSAAPQNAALQHTMLNGEAEYEAAIDTVIANAEHILHIFDPDLGAGGYNTAKRCEALRAFLMKNRANRLIMVLHETDFLTRQCPRLMQLLKLYSHAISILQTQEHGRVAGDPLVIADATHYVHRFHSGSARALLALRDPAGARQLDERFGQLQEASSPAIFAVTLGL